MLLTIIFGFEVLHKLRLHKSEKHPLEIIKSIKQSTIVFTFTLVLIHGHHDNMSNSSEVKVKNIVEDSLSVSTARLRYWSVTRVERQVDNVAEVGVSLL